MNIYQLKWSQVCPDRYTFDSSLALPIAIDAIRNTPVNPEYPGRWTQAVEDEIDRSFIEAYGDWAARLVFEFFIQRSGFFIKDLQPVFSLPRVAGRKEDYLDFLRMVVILCQRSCVSPTIEHSCSGQLRDF